MSTPDFPYIRIGVTHINKWFPDLQISVPGFEYTVRCTTTGDVAPVFVDDAHNTEANYRMAVEHVFAPLNATYAIGRTPAA